MFFKNKNKIQIIINAAVDIDDLKGKKLDYEKTLKQIYINFINQYLLIAKILNKSKNNQINICLISSVNVFLFDKVFSLGYNLSKSLQFELYKFFLTRFKNYNVKIIFLSGMIFIDFFIPIKLSKNYWSCCMKSNIKIYLFSQKLY